MPGSSRLPFMHCGSCSEIAARIGLLELPRFMLKCLAACPKRGIGMPSPFPDPLAHWRGVRNSWSARIVRERR